MRYVSRPLGNGEARRAAPRSARFGLALAQAAADEVVLEHPEAEAGVAQPLLVGVAVQDHAQRSWPAVLGQVEAERGQAVLLGRASASRR